jgi:tetratricopeptide (TPR) repeat protein
MSPTALSVACLILLTFCGVFPNLARRSFASPQSQALEYRESPVAGLPESEEISRAKKLLAEGRREQAISLLQTLLRSHPEDGDAHLLLGIALSTVPRRNEALQELQKAVDLNPGSAVAYFSLGNAQARFANMNAAREAFARAVKLDPSFLPARISLAMVLAQQKQLEAARNDLAEAIALVGQKPPAAYPHFLLAQVLVQQGHLHQALKELDAATALRPRYAEAYLNAGLIRTHLLQDRAALVDFRKAAELSPRNVEAQVQLGGAYFRLGMPSQAVEPLRKAVAMRPGDRKTLYQLCEALQRTERKQDALACEEKLSVLVRKGLAETDNLRAAGELNNEGIKLQDSGNLAAAIKEYRAAVRLDPQQTVFRRNLALALCRLGRWEDGAIELRKVLKQDPSDTEATKMLYIALDHTTRR